MKNLKVLPLIILMIFCGSCVIKKEISINIIDSDKVEVKPNMFGSAFEDVSPKLSLPIP